MRRISVNPETGCWIFTGYTSKLWYGQIKVERRMMKAHRLSYELHVGDIPDGLEIDHKCKVRACCNPQHLEPVTHLVNMHRGAHRAKTHCAHGHPYSAQNTMVYTRDWRQCRECHRLVQKAKRFLAGLEHSK